MTRFFSTLSPALLGASLMLAAGVLFAAVNTIVQYGTMIGGLAPSKVAFWQYFIALAFSVPWLLTKGIRSLKTSNPAMHVARVVVAAAGVQFWVMSLAHIPIWQAIALIMLSPFFVTFGASLFLRETASFERWCAVIVGFAGGMIILAPWSESSSVYAVLAIAAAAMWAMSSLMTKHLTKTETPEALTVYLLLLLTPINAVLAMGDGLMPRLEGAWPLLIAAGLMTGLAQYALVKAYSSADAAYLQPFDHLKLPLNVGLGIAVFGFVPPGSMWFGSILIVSASFYLLHRETQSASI